MPSLFNEADEMIIASSRRIRKVPADYVPEVLPPTGRELTMEVHKEHADEVLGRLLEAYEQKKAPYDQDRVRLPHDPRHMPRTLQRDGAEHAMFLFNVCYYMRGGIKSNDAVKRMSGVYDEWPELFDCETASRFSPGELASILKLHGLGFQETVAGQWIENSRRMQEKFDGDPRNMFAGVSTYEESQEIVQNDGKGEGFLGFQEKMTSMIIYYLMDEELIEPFNFPIPIDLHVMRISIANEFITFPDAPYGTNLFTKETLAALRKLYADYSAENDVSPLRLCDAVWMLSESSCGRHPGNTTLEPLGREYRNGRSTYLIPGTVNTRSLSQQAAYESSCRVCPLENTCRYNIPGTHYYVGGNVIIRGERERFPIPISIARTYDQMALFTDL
jgi:hypothetical protein